MNLISLTLLRKRFGGIHVNVSSIVSSTKHFVEKISILSLNIVSHLEDTYDQSNELYLNTFLSTTCNRQMSIHFANESVRNRLNVQSVLFEIILHSTSKENRSRPFANISSRSFYRVEQEALLSLILEGFADLYQLSNDTVRDLEYRSKALQIYVKSFHIYHPSLVCNSIRIDELYDKQDDIEKALLSYLAPSRLSRDITQAIEQHLTALIKMTKIYIKKNEVNLVFHYTIEAIEPF